LKNMVKISSKGQVTLPKKLRIKYQLEPGQYVIFKETEDGIIVKKASTSPVDKFNDLKKDISKRFKEKGINPDEVEEAIRWARSQK